MKFLHAVVAPLALSGAFMLAVAGPARAEDCQKRIVNADHKLHEAINHHGPNSPEAQHWREELASARGWCWDHEHKWWDEDAHAWRTEHWDDHDHDH
jgi:hypothetical protein